MKVSLVSLRAYGALSVAAALLAAPLWAADFAPLSSDSQTASQTANTQYMDGQQPSANAAYFLTGSVYTASNATDGNRVMIFDQVGNTLVFRRSFPTGGAGTGGGLGNAGGVTLHASGRWLFVVNAGSDEISVFEVGPQLLALTDVVPSGGTMPISVTAYEDLVYVLNAGDGGSISGFTLDLSGRLTPIAGSTQPLTGAGPAQIGFSTDGAFLAVTEKGANLIDVFPVDGSGVAGPPVANASSGQTPFGFTFDDAGTLIVSEAAGGAPDASTVSSYSINPDGTLTTISPSVATMESAACWVVVTDNGRFAYTTNTGSGTVSGLHVAGDGSLSLLDPDGVTGMTGAGPIDAAFNFNSRALYVLDSGTNDISIFRVQRHNGGLTPLDVVGGLPAGANGIAAQ